MKALLILLHSSTQNKYNLIQLKDYWLCLVYFKFIVTGIVFNFCIILPWSFRIMPGNSFYFVINITLLFPPWFSFQMFNFFFIRWLRLLRCHLPGSLWSQWRSPKHRPVSVLSEMCDLGSLPRGVRDHSEPWSTPVSLSSSSLVFVINISILFHFFLFFSPNLFFFMMIELEVICYNWTSYGCIKADSSDALCLESLSIGCAWGLGRITT